MTLLFLAGAGIIEVRYILGRRTWECSFFPSAAA
jgi:hypothetical protein